MSNFAAMKKIIVLGALSPDMISYLNEKELQKVHFGPVEEAQGAVEHIGAADMDTIMSKAELFEKAGQVIWNEPNATLFDMVLNMAPAFCSILLWNTEALQNLDMDFYSTVHFKNLILEHRTNAD